MSARRPRIVVVTGVPGSGKTTLATELARALRVPFLARDDVRGGLFFTAGVWTDEVDRVPSADEAVEVFLQTVEGLLAHGVSCVVEYVVRVHRPADLERLMAAGDCVVVITGCADASGRVARRNLADRFVANPALLAAAGVESVEAHTEVVVARMQEVEREMRRDFPLPVLHVDTSGDLRPGIDEIVAFATRVA